MRKLTLILFLIINISLLFPANDNKSVDAPALGLGGASVANVNEYAACNNQALLSLMDSVTIATTYSRNFAIDNIQLMAGVPVSFGTLGFNVSRMGLKHYAEYKLGVAYARSFGDNFGAALQADVLSVLPGINERSVYQFTAELGLWYRPIEDLTIGFHAYNFINAKYKLLYYNERVPVNLKLGLAYSIFDNFIITAELENSSEYGTSLRGGMEYRIMDIVVCRVGGASNPALASIGLGVILNNLRIDVAGQAIRYIGKTASVSLSYTF